MHHLEQLKKQQVGLRLPKYLVDEIDDLTKNFSINRTDIIIEAIKSYVSEQKAKIFYDDFDNSCQELKAVVNNKKDINDLQTLDELIDELENN